MGFIKKQNHTIDSLGLTIPMAYAKIGTLVIVDERAHATFNVHQDRQSILDKNSLESVSFSTTVDKTQPIYSQVYEAAKADVFAGWEDDIVE